VAEVMAGARRQGFFGFGGFGDECESECLMHSLRWRGGINAGKSPTQAKLNPTRTRSWRNGSDLSVRIVYPATPPLRPA
jgi:hypothetical protein